MALKLIGRTAEQEILQEFYDPKYPEFLAIYVSIEGWKQDRKNFLILMVAKKLK